MINTAKNIEANILYFTFSDNGEVLASFRLNPTDVRIADRVRECAEHFAQAAKDIPECVTFDDALKYNNDMEDKICYVLGYDAHKELFGFVSATTILADGEMFAKKVMRLISDAVIEDLRKRREAIMAAVKKHTAKYE